MRDRQKDHYLSVVATRALLVECGARKQGVLRAPWEHVDLGRGAITVPKAKSGQPRTIPFSSFATEIVRRQLAVREGDCAWVCPGPTDRDKPLDSVRRAWAAAKKDAGLPDHIVIHSLQHSFSPDHVPGRGVAPGC